MSFLKVDQVKKIFTGDRRDKIVALADLSLNCDEGEFLCIVGPTGCGKTTLLRLIAGLETPNSGRIMIRDQEISGMNRDITLVFQQYSLFPWRNVIDNIAFSLEMRGFDRKVRYKRAEELIQLVGLLGFERAYPYELSGGMQQRVAIARALAHDPGLLLLDEPFGALDERTRHLLQEKLLTIWETEKKTIIFVTHNIDEAIFLATRILVMRDRPGGVEQEITVDLSRPRDPRARGFLDLHIMIRGILERILIGNGRR